MATYILKKYLPLIKAGTEVIFSEMHNGYIRKDHCPGDLTYPIVYEKFGVENTPEFFEKKEPVNYTESWEYQQQQEMLKEIKKGWEKVYEDINKRYLEGILKIEQDAIRDHFKFKTTPAEDRETFIKTHCPKRPPLGIMPEYLWVEQRVRELQEAIERYNFKDCEAWINEWTRHANWLMNRKKEENAG